MTKQPSLSGKAWRKRGFVLILTGIGFASMGAMFSPGLPVLNSMTHLEFVQRHIGKHVRYPEGKQVVKISRTEQKMNDLLRSSRLIERSA